LTGANSRPTTPRPLRPQGPARLAILGPAGIGKSSIAQRVMHHSTVADLYGDRRIWVPCGDAVNAEQVVEKMISTLGVEDCIEAGSDKTTKLMALLGPSSSSGTASASSSGPSSSVGSSASSYVQSETSSLAGDRDSAPNSPPTLLVLDGLDKAWAAHNTRYEVENLLNLLAALTNLALVITMAGKERPLGVKWTRPFLSIVPPLKVEDGAKIFTAIADIEDEKVWEIVEACGGSPLLITQNATSAQFESLTSLLRRVKQQKEANEPIDIDMGSLSIRSDIANRL